MCLRGRVFFQDRYCSVTLALCFKRASQIIGCTERPGRAGGSELRAELAYQLASISANQARVVVLKDAFDWSFEEISSRSGMPVGSA